jgi:hypothetical protein
VTVGQRNCSVLGRPRSEVQNKTFVIWNILNPFRSWDNK